MAARCGCLRTACALSVGLSERLVRSLHKARPATADNIAAHIRQLSREFLHLFVGGCAGLETRRAKDSHTIILSSRATKARQLVNDFPQAGDSAFKEFDGGVFVTETNDVRLSEG